MVKNSEGKCKHGLRLGTCALCRGDKQSYETCNRDLCTELLNSDRCATRVLTRYGYRTIASSLSGRDRRARRLEKAEEMTEKSRGLHTPMALTYKDKGW